MEPRRPTIDASRLWAGGVATALVAALIAVVGVLIARGVFDINVLAPASAGRWGGTASTWYAVGAATASLVATALAQLLLAFTPSPMRFFTWVMVLGTAVAVVGSALLVDGYAAKFAVSVLNLVLGTAIGTLVAGTAASAVRAPDYPDVPR